MEPPPRKGRYGNSPALQCRESGCEQPSPGGTTESNVRLSRPSGTWVFIASIPSTEVLGYFHSIPGMPCLAATGDDVGIAVL